MNSARLLPLAALLAAFALAAWRAPAPAAATFAPPASSTAAPLPAAIERAMLPGFGRPVGGASLAMLPDGRVAAAWQGQLDNGDDGLWFSVRGTAGWAPPVLAAMRESSAGGSLARIDGLGRPLLQVEGSQLALWYASAVFGEATGGALYRGRSTDSGKTWLNARRQASGPIASLGGEPVGLIALADGGFLLALAESSLHAQGAWLHIDATGRLRGKARQTALPGAPLRALAALDEQRAVALAGRDGRLHALRTEDAGRSWHVLSALPETVADRPTALLRLADGRLLLAGNRGDRRHLQLWLSADDGASWQAGPLLDSADDGAAEFDRPALVQTRDNRIHLAYTWRGQGIRHLAFTPAWLTEGKP